MARVLLCPLDYAVIVNKRISDLDGGTKCCHRDRDQVFASNIKLAEILHAPWYRISAAHYNEENLCLRTAQLLFNVFGRLLVLPGLLPMGICQAGPVLVPDCDVNDHEPIMVFDNQIRLLQIAANVHSRLDKGEESPRQSFSDEVLALIYYSIFPLSLAITVWSSANWRHRYHSCPIPIP